MSAGSWPSWAGAASSVGGGSGSGSGSSSGGGAAMSAISSAGRPPGVSASTGSGVASGRGSRRSGASSAGPGGSGVASAGGVGSSGSGTAVAASGAGASGASASAARMLSSRRWPGFVTWTVRVRVRWGVQGPRPVEQLEEGTEVGTLDQRLVLRARGDLTGRLDPLDDPRCSVAWSSTR